MTDNIYIPKTANQAKFNCKVKYYPDNSIKITAFNQKIYNPYYEIKKTYKESYVKTNIVVTSNSTKIERERNDSIRRTKEKIFDIASANCDKWKYMITLTLDSKKIDRYNCDVVNKKFKKWLNNMVTRKGLVYLIIPELHADGAIHFHGLINDSLSMVDSGTYRVIGYKTKPLKLSTLKSLDLSIDNDDVQIIYNVVDYKLGFSSAIKLDNNKTAVCRYIIKYITKDNDKIMGKYYYAGGKNLQRSLPCEYLNLDFNSIEAFSYPVPNNRFLSVKYIDIKGD